MRSRIHSSIRLAGVVAFGFAVILPTPARGDDPQKNHGRLPDGRAYRTGSDGLQLVDQMAELQVTVDELQNQVRILEDDAASKQERIEELTRGVAPASHAVRESTLAKSSNPAPIASRMNSDADCARVSLPLNQRIAQLEAQVSSTSAAVPCNCDSQTRVLRDQVTNLQNMLMSAPSKESLARELAAKRDVQLDLQSQATQVASLSKDLSATRTSLDNAEEQLKEKLAREQELLKQIDQLHEQIADAQSESKGAAASRVTRSDRSDDVKPVDASAARGRFDQEPVEEDEETSTHTPGELAQAKASFSRTLSEIQALVMKRKDLHDAMKDRGKGVSISLQPLVAESGASLDNLRLEVSRLNGTSNLDQLRVGLTQIEHKLQDDIGTLQRLTK